MSLEEIIKKINKHDYLTTEENHYLFTLRNHYENEIQRSLINNILFQGNEGIVYTVLKKYMHWKNYDDILQEGRLSLLLAIQNYDCGSEIIFFTYASQCIRNNINAYLLEKDRFIRIPRSVLKKSKKILDDFRQPYSLNKLITTEDGETEFEYIDSIADSRNIEQEVIDEYEKEMVYAGIQSLPELEQNIIRDRFGIGTDAEMTLCECSKKYGLPVSKIYRLEKKAIDALKRLHQTEHLY